MLTRERRLALFGARLLRVILGFSVLVLFLSLLLEGFAVYETVTKTDLKWLVVDFDFTLMLPVKMTIAKSAYNVSTGGEFQLTAPYAGIGVPWTAMPETVRFLIALLIPCVLAFYVYVTFCLQKMFASFAAGRPFQSASVHALRLIAWVLIVQYAIGQSTVFLSYWILKRVAVSGEVSVAPPALFQWSDGLNFVIGVTLLLIAWAFSRAALTERERDVLQEEQDLTV